MAKTHTVAAISVSVPKRETVFVTFFDVGSHVQKDLDVSFPVFHRNSLRNSAVEQTNSLSELVFELTYDLREPEELGSGVRTMVLGSTLAEPKVLQIPVFGRPCSLTTHISTQISE